MARLRCPCGETLSNVLSPSPNVGHLVTDAQVENMLDNRIDQAQLMEMARYIWECGNCGRLAVSFPRQPHVVWYVPEDGKPKHLMDPDGWE